MFVWLQNRYKGKSLFINVYQLPIRDSLRQPSLGCTQAPGSWHPQTLLRKTPRHHGWVHPWSEGSVYSCRPILPSAWPIALLVGLISPLVELIPPLVEPPLHPCFQPSPPSRPPQLEDQCFWHRSSESFGTSRTRAFWSLNQICEVPPAPRSCQSHCV